MKKRLLKGIRIKRSNHGSTLVEMIVCFALLGIFMICGAALLSNITMIYYQIKGESYSQEVADIMMKKMVSEIEGAEFFDELSGLEEDNPEVAADHLSIRFFDKTDTRVLLKMKNEKVVVSYDAITVKNGDEIDANLSRNATDWYFDDSVYNGFAVSELLFYRGGQKVGGDNDDSLAVKYGLEKSTLTDYDDDIILILLELNSGKYGVYHFYRYVRMNNAPD